MATKNKHGERQVRLKDGSVFLFPKVEEVDFAETLRDAIRDGGLTQYQLSKVTGIPQAVLSSFLAGKDLRLATFNKLANAMGFELRRNAAKAPRRRK